MRGQHRRPTLFEKTDMSENKRPPSSPLDDDTASKKLRDEMDIGQSPVVGRPAVVRVGGTGGTGGTGTASGGVAVVGAGACGDGSPVGVAHSGLPGSGPGSSSSVDLSDATIARIVEAVSNRVRNDLSKEINVLKGKVIKLSADLELKQETISRMREEIELLQHRGDEAEARLEEIESYGRRNSVRIHGIPEPVGNADEGSDSRESTDNIIVKLCEEIGADVFHENIDRSHRVGRKGDYIRPILCKFTSHKHKLSLLRMKKKLEDIDTKSLFNAEKVYVNEDLTKQRAQVAKVARSMKKAKKISDTWTKDGVIFLKPNSNNIMRVTKMRDLSMF